MSRRNELVQTIQTLSREEAKLQPSAADWLKQQDEVTGSADAPSLTGPSDVDRNDQEEPPE